MAELSAEEHKEVKKGQAFEDMLHTEGWKFLEMDLQIMEQIAMSKFAGSSAYDNAGASAMFELRGRVKAIRNILSHIEQSIERKEIILRKLSGNEKTKEMEVYNGKTERN